jgi:hypothetical protein
VAQALVAPQQAVLVVELVALELVVLPLAVPLLAALVL